MGINSYAQNFEDVMLWRALGHIQNGFYIDVGAWSPDIDSVTRAFYEKGWNGINIEPNPKFYRQYLHKRANDINLNLAISDEIGTTEIYFVSNPGLSSLDKSIAEGHIALGLTAKPSLVNITRLAKICETFAENQTIHFLKVDVEGFEKNVFLGNDWNKFRPWIIVAEATLPMSQVENYKEWENILLSADYIFAYADGLNRFYVSKEHKELIDFFKYPPNVFDGFTLFKVETDEYIYRSQTILCVAEHGFYAPESWGIWARGESATMSVKVTENQEFPVLIDLKLKLKVFTPLLEYSPVIKISQKNQVLAYVFFRKQTQEINEIAIRLRCEQDECELLFESTHEGSPIEFGSVDNRVLGFGMTVISAEIIMNDMENYGNYTNPLIVGIAS